MTVPALKAPELGPNYKWTAPANTTAAVFMSQVDGSIVLIAVPAIFTGSGSTRWQLQTPAVDTLVVAGISTTGVVLSTVRDAHDKDYRLIVLADLCADRDTQVTDWV
jgi:nicotinamidase-related amidase